MNLQSICRDLLHAQHSHTYMQSCICIPKMSVCCCLQTCFICACDGCTCKFPSSSINYPLPRIQFVPLSKKSLSDPILLTEVNKQCHISLLPLCYRPCFCSLHSGERQQLWLPCCRFPSRLHAAGHPLLKE